MGFGAALGMYAAVGAVMAHGLTRSRRLPVLDTPDSIGLDYEPVAFPSRTDELPLSGWLMRPMCGHRASELPWVIMVHGHGSHRADPAAGSLALARDLVELGYGVLTFDLRACGISPGGRASAGYHEQRDVLGALDFLYGLGARAAQIGVHGLSMGAVAALITCAVPGRAASVVADSAFAELGLMIDAGAVKRWGLLKIFRFGMHGMARLLYGIHIGRVAPAKALAGTSFPVMIIHGEADEVVPTTQFRLLARAVEDSRSDVWLVPGAGHAQAYRTHPREYVDRVDRFFRSTLDVTSAHAVFQGAARGTTDGGLRPPAPRAQYSPER